MWIVVVIVGLARCSTLPLNSLKSREVRSREDAIREYEADAGIFDNKNTSGFSTGFDEFTLTDLLNSNENGGHGSRIQRHFKAVNSGARHRSLNYARITDADVRNVKAKLNQSSFRQQELSTHTNDELVPLVTTTATRGQGNLNNFSSLSSNYTSNKEQYPRVEIHTSSNHKNYDIIKANTSSTFKTRELIFKSPENQTVSKKIVVITTSIPLEKAMKTNNANIFPFLNTTDPTKENYTSGNDTKPLLKALPQDKQYGNTSKAEFKITTINNSYAVYHNIIYKDKNLGKDIKENNNSALKVKSTKDEIVFNGERSSKYVDGLNTLQNKQDVVNYETMKTNANKSILYRNLESNKLNHKQDENIDTGKKITSELALPLMLPQRDLVSRKFKKNVEELSSRNSSKTIILVDVISSSSEVSFKQFNPGKNISGETEVFGISKNNESYWDGTKSFRDGPLATKNNTSIANDMSSARHDQLSSNDTKIGSKANHQNSSTLFKKPNSSSSAATDVRISSPASINKEKKPSEGTSNRANVTLLRRNHTRMLTFHPHEASSQIQVSQKSLVERGRPGLSLVGHTERAITSGAVAAIVFGVLLLMVVIGGAAAYLVYKRMEGFLPKILSSDRSCANSDSGGYLDDQCRVAYVNSQIELSKNTPEDLVSLDNDSFLNSLESMTIQNLWTDTIRHTKL